MREHVCEPAEPICCCYLLADEPSEKCSIHGGAPFVLRCKHCGKFMKRKQESLEEVIDSTSCVDVEYEELDDDPTKSSQEGFNISWKLFFYDPSMYIFIFLIAIIILLFLEKINL